MLLALSQKRSNGRSCNPRTNLMSGLSCNAILSSSLSCSIKKIRLEIDAWRPIGLKVCEFESFIDIALVSDCLVKNVTFWPGDFVC